MKIKITEMKEIRKRKRNIKRTKLQLARASKSKQERLRATHLDTYNATNMIQDRVQYCLEPFCYPRLADWTAHCPHSPSPHTYAAVDITTLTRELLLPFSLPLSRTLLPFSGIIHTLIIDYYEPSHEHQIVLYCIRQRCLDTPK